MTVHLLAEVKSQDYTTGCGKLIRSSTMPDNISGWGSDLTCPLCVTRLFVVHKRLENLVEMTKTLDLDDPTVAKKFHFSGKRFGFRWLLDGPVIYVYETPESFSPALALPIQNFVPEVCNRECTYTDAQSTAREWIVKHGDNFTVSAPTKHKRTVVKTAPVIPEGYTGALCKGCGKIDEGDFMQHPEDILSQLCMACLVDKNYG